MNQISPEINPKINREIKIHSISLGCPKTRVDTEKFLGRLACSLLAVDDPAEADIVFVNTCGFIRPAVEESLETIFELLATLEQNSSRPLLAVAGCLVSRYGQELSSEIPEVDLFLPLDCQEEWPQKVADALKLAAAPLWGRTLTPDSGYAYLKVSEGCNCNCRFCTIPSMRGPLRSASLQDLKQEGSYLIDSGIKEIVMVAQDLTAYGQDLGMRHGLQKLIETLLGLPGLKRLRLMYLYPSGITSELLKFIAECGSPLLPYLDIPFQHSHAQVLRSMGRPFQNDPRQVLAKIRKYLPDAVLRTTLITGYPGETEAQFEDLKDFVNTARFHHLGVFPFYPEEGTPAAAMENQIDEELKTARQQDIMALQNRISAEIMDGYLGSRQEVLIDEASPEWPGLYVGKTWFQAPEVDGQTYISGPGVKPGKIVECEIIEAKTYDLVGLAD